MSRARRAVRAPSPQHDFTAFPSETSSSQRVFRSHGVGYGAWYFSSNPSEDGGRFDLPAPEGTCYLADSVDVSVRERLGPTYSHLSVVPEHIAAGFQVTEVDLAAGKQLADFTEPDGARFGLTNELSSMDSYATPQIWARTLRKAGFDGIRYLARFTPARGANAFALFGTAGGRRWACHGVTDGMTASRNAGYEVLPASDGGNGIGLGRPPGVA